MAKLDLVILVALIALMAIGITSAFYQSDWKQRCVAAGGVPIVDRTSNRVCFAKEGGTIEVPMWFSTR